jgi:nucleoside 2-deoxyribosyltransferase
MTTGKIGLAASDADGSALRRVFVSAPAETDVSPLIEALERRSAQPYVLSDVALLGANILDNLQEAIRRADLVVVVLVGAASSLNSAFEAGWAVASGKTVVVVADPEVQLPVDFANLLTVRARVDDISAITFALDQAEGRDTATSHSAAAVSKALGPRADELIDRAARLMTTARPAERGQAVVEILTEALESSGALPVEATRRDDWFDMAVWLDDLDGIAANPLLIEVKIKFDLSAVRQALAALTAVPNARAALIVYLESTSASRAVLQEAHFPVLAISLSDLLERMKTTSFGEVVRYLRNRSVHGWLPR